MRPPQTLPIGQGELLREGHHITLVALGPLVWQALEAADKLSRKGISAAVINARFAKPLDTELLAHWVDRTGRLLTVEDHVISGGFGSAVLEWLAETGRMVPVRRLGIPDMFVEHGAVSVLHRELGLDAEGIARAAEQLVLSTDREARQWRTVGGVD